MDDLQGAVDPGVSVRVTIGWPVQVKDHQLAVQSSQVEEVPQHGYCLVLRPDLVIRVQRGDGPEGVTLRRMRVRKISASTWFEPGCQTTLGTTRYITDPKLNALTPNDFSLNTF